MASTDRSSGNFDDAERVRVGNSVRFEDLCLRLVPKIRQVIFKRSGDPLLAEEVAGETLLQAYRSRDTFDPNRPMWPWLLKIALRVHARTRRRRLRTTPLALTSEDELSVALPDPNPEQRVLAHQNEALRALRPRYRRVLTLKHVERLSYTEIAKLEGLSFTGVNSLLQRARAALRRAVEETRGHLEIAVWIPFRTLVARARALSARTSQAADALGTAICLSAEAAMSIVVAMMLVTGIAALAGSAEAFTADLLIRDPIADYQQPADVAEVPTRDAALFRQFAHDAPEQNNTTIQTLSISIAPPEGVAPDRSAGAVVESGKGKQRSWEGRTWTRLLPGGEEDTSGNVYTRMECDERIVAQASCALLDMVP